ncbi:deoxyribodipyrimidine photo-lyase [bacterium]|nr:deoxyribodipyrimidine photo-lyase [bacterium]
MGSKSKVNVVWLRRDLRLQDHRALFEACEEDLPVLILFIFDTDIIDSLPKDDHRITFIYDQLKNIHLQLQKKGSSLLVKKGKPIDIWKQLLNEFEINSVYINKDYEPYARERDQSIEKLLSKAEVQTLFFKDQVIFEEHEVLKSDGDPYTVYTPYKRKWLDLFEPKEDLKEYDPNLGNVLQVGFNFPSLNDIGFERSKKEVKPYDISELKDYEKLRNFPARDKTSYLSPHLRFGTIGIRHLIKSIKDQSDTFLSELIWREFFMQILFHYPRVVTENFRKKYDAVVWRNNKEEFEKWCKGETGYPMVDAGMRQLNETGYMHNRVRMVVASFLCKHLLIDWRWGEAYFAEKLFDYELSSNNGNWQWAAGTGCDAAPYFRVFNPSTQIDKFDPQNKYIKEWVKDLNEFSYPSPMVEHKSARERALEAYSVVKEN